MPYSRSATAAALATALVLGAFAVSAAAEPSSSSTTAKQTCAWPYEVSADAANVFSPDSSAAYWVQPFTVQDNENIVLHGDYPDSRYGQLAVYDANGGAFKTNGVGSSLTDYATAPDAGSVNPFQQATARSGRYTVTVSQNPQPGEANTLPLAPAGTAAGSTGYLVYRVYLPAGGDFSKVSMPKITIESNGTSTTLQACGSGSVSGTAQGNTALPSSLLQHLGSATDTAGSATATATPAAPVDGTSAPFARPGATGGGFPDPDSGYLKTTITPPTGDNVVVIRGKAPTHSPGDHPSPWPAEGTDMRYWSMCVDLTSQLRPLVVNTLPNGTEDYGCRADEDTRLDASGAYTYVIGTEAQRARIEQIPNATFLPFSTSHRHEQVEITLRNMLVSSGFAEAIQNVPTDDDPSSAATVMGPYYPTDVVCSLNTLRREGVDACFAGTAALP
jgi:hypothetical protein